MFWIVTWPISHRFRDKRRFPSKIANFSHLRVYIAPAGIGYRPRAPQRFNPALVTSWALTHLPIKCQPQGNPKSVTVEPRSCGWVGIWTCKPSGPSTAYDELYVPILTAYTVHQTVAYTWRSTVDYKFGPRTDGEERRPQCYRSRSSSQACIVVSVDKY